MNLDPLCPPGSSFPAFPRAVLRRRILGALLGIAALGDPTGRAATPDFTRMSDAFFPPPNRDVFSGAWGDFDGDGRPDLFQCGLDEGPGELWRNTPSGFVRVTGQPWDRTILPRGGAAWGDVNNDGRLDLYVAGAYGRPDALYLNEGTGTFRNLPVPGVLEGFGISPLWSDFDRDGALDLFVVNGGGSVAEPSFVLRNTGDGTLVRELAGDAATRAQYGHGAAFGDYDGDGDDDLFVLSAWNQPNSLYRNDGNGVFTRTAQGEVGAEGAGGGAMAAWGDYDNDGDLDLFWVQDGPGSPLFRNDQGRLVRLDPGPLALIRNETVGAAWADFDNDGRLDLVLARRAGTPEVFRGLGNGEFEATGDPALRDEGAPANGLAIADYDLDGDLDVWFSNWGGAATRTQLFRNDTAGGNHLRIRLQGVRSNRDGIGAKIRLRTVVGGVARWQLRVVGGFDGMGSHELIAHFGLGPATEADLIRVEWPSGTVRELLRTAANQVLEIREAPAAPLGILPDGGRFETSLQVTIHSTIPSAEIRYTLDGAEPNPTSPLYPARLVITNATTVRARLYVNGFPVSEIVSHTYHRIYAFDHDGISPAWRTRHFGPDFAIDPRAAADADPDADGSTNRRESAFNSDPLDPLSGFRVGVRAAPEVRFASVPGRSYRILRLDAVHAGDPRVVAEIVASGPETVWVDLEAGRVANPAHYVVQPVP